MKVVFPLPFSPTTASRRPTWNFMFTCRRAQISVLGYLKDTSRNSTSYCRSARFSVVREPWYMEWGMSKKEKISSMVSALPCSSPGIDSREEIFRDKAVTALTYWVT